MEPSIPEEFSRCDICKSSLGSVRMDTPLYCVSCVEKMDKLNMNLKKYRKHTELNEALKKT